MNRNDSQSVDAEVEALRKRSAELIAEVCRINRRIDEIAPKAPPCSKGPDDSANAGPGITDTWVDDGNTDGRGPASAP